MLIGLFFKILLVFLSFSKGVVIATMLKTVLVLGCLLSLALAHPVGKTAAPSAPALLLYAPLMLLWLL